MSDDEAGGASRMMYAPAETRNWLVLKEGYLLKTKKLTLRNSTKLRWFILKQHPETLSSRLEYFEGMSMRGGISLDRANIKMEKEGVFLVETSYRTFILQAEKGDLKSSMTWVIALQNAIKKSKQNPRLQESSAERLEKLMLDEEEDPSGQRAPTMERTGTSRIRGGTRGGQLDGNAIDAARWAALRKRMTTVNIEPDEEDEDLRLMREAEAEEERRQEEERQLWIARAHGTAPASATATTTATATGQNDANSQEEHSSATNDSAAPAVPAEVEVPDASKGDVSEEDDFELSMRRAEEEEERRQAAEREAFLATRTS